jgi:glycosyltransferase involved in cell wall biosynthesis
MAQDVDGLRTLFVSGIDGDTRRYRCFHQQEQLAMQGIDTGFRESDDPQLLVDVLDYDVFILHRVPHSRLIGTVIDVARLRGKPVVCETDDLVFAPELYDRIGFVDTLSPEDARQFHDDLRLHAETFQRCDCVLTTTDFLAREARDRGKPAYVNRNAPSQEMIRISELALASRRQNEEEGGQEVHPLVVGYFSGTGSHNRDFRVITEPLIWMLETYPQTWLHISGNLELASAFAPYGDRIRRAPYVDWRELPYLIARVDVNLAPLEQDNPFCRAKSENKFVEAALVGVPTIASPVEALEFAITDAEDGLLARTPEEWQDALGALIDSPSRRREMGEAARRTAHARYKPEARGSGLVETLQRIVDRHGGPLPPSEHILQEWGMCMADYSRGMYQDALTWEARVESLRQALAHYEDQLIQTVREKERLRGIIEHQRLVIERREELIEAIMQGRVMRLMTSTQRWLRSIRGD